jgi:hypothetical protein
MNFFLKILLLLFTALLLYINIKLHSGPGLENREETKQDVIRQLNFLEDELKNKNLGLRMQELFPEGFVFTNVLYGLAWTEVAKTEKEGSEIFRHAVTEARSAYRRINSEDGSEIFDTDLKPDHGIFYEGWKNFLLGKILELTHKTDSSGISEFKASCREIADAFAANESPYLQSYHGSSWPADAFVGMGSLKQHDKIFPSAYDGLIRSWISRVRSNLDSETGLVPHSVNAFTGKTTEGARGSSICLMLIFMADIDPGFARQQFNLLKEKFLVTRFGLPAIREYPEGKEGSGDVDSGPVIMDVGFSGTIVSIGSFKKFGEYGAANKISGCIEGFGFPISGSGGKKYLSGILPTADAFIAWARMLQPNTELQTSKEDDVDFGSYNRFHVYSFIIVLLLAAILFRKNIMKKKKLVADG